MGPQTGENGLTRRASRQAFYVLMETPCPYLPGRYERKLMTEIGDEEATETYSLLSRAGFRRSHNYAYRPACNGCTACVAVRVRVDDFAPSRSLRRVERLNRHLVAEDRPAHATREQFGVFNRYIRSRHGDGEMAGMTFSEFRAMVEDSRLDTRVTEFRDETGGLVAGCLTDSLEDGFSAVYSYFEPSLSGRGLGNYMVLWLIREAHRVALPFVYLGYWIGESPKMAYKARFQPLEGLGPAGWEIFSG